MRMTEVKVGQRLRPKFSFGLQGWNVTVTELTEKGFKYKYDNPIPLIPRWGIAMLAEGHEHYGYNGEAFFEPVDGSLD